jgi:hypothetical protein
VFFLQQLPKPHLTSCHFTAESDYVTFSETITFFAGQSEGSVSISTIEDPALEQLEDFTALLTNPSEGLTVGAEDTARIDIMDDEGHCHQKRIL